MTRQLCRTAFAVVMAMSLGLSLQAAPIAIINPGGEVYPENATGNLTTPIPVGGLDPIGATGWNSTRTGVLGIDGVEAIDAANANSGIIRLAFGAIDTSPNAAEDFVLFQETSHVVAEGDSFALDFFGRAFFQFNAGVDVQTSLFGYLDGVGNLVPVNTMAHPTTVLNEWNAAMTHTYTIPALSPLIGENLVIGFFTDTPGVGAGGFTSVDDVSLSLVPEPTSWVLSMVGAIGILGRRVRRKATIA